MMSWQEEAGKDICEKMPMQCSGQEQEFSVMSYFEFLVVANKAKLPTPVAV